MAIGSGLAAQLGIATESTFNTPVAVTRFYEFTDESLNLNKNRATSQGLRAGGQLPRLERTVITTSDVTGDVSLDLTTKGLGLLLAHATGTFPTKTAGAFTFGLGDIGASSFTCQVGVPQYGGTVVPKTVSGCKISSWELAVSNAGIATGRFTIDGAAMTTATALATASYPASANLFHFAASAISIDGTPVANIRDFTLSVDNAIKADRYNLGAAGTKAAQVHNGFRPVTGTVTAEFTDSVLLNKVMTDATASMTLTFTNGADSLAITVSAVKFNGETPKVSGPEAVDVQFTFEAFDNGSTAPLSIVYTTADSAL